MTWILLLYTHKVIWLPSPGGGPGITEENKMSPTATHRSVAFKLSLTALLSLLLVLLVTMGIVSALLWQNFGRLSRGDAQQYADQLRTLVQTFDETAQEQAKRDFTLFKANFPGDFSLSEVPGLTANPKPPWRFRARRSTVTLRW